MHLIAAMGHQYHPAMHIAGPHMIVPAGKLMQGGEIGNSLQHFMPNKLVQT